MEINYEKLKQMINKHSVPRWGNGDDEWSLRPGGGETYIQESVLKNASIWLTEDELEKDPKKVILNAINAPLNNLLSSFDKMYAKTFLENVSENELRSNLLNLLFGIENIEIRLTKFHQWSKLTPISGEKKKQGFNPMVISYLLVMSNPKEYAFCKPKVYNPAVENLLGKDKRQTKPIERILHCQQFYKQVLQYLEENHNLIDGNLLDVHSLFYLFYEKNWGTEEIPTQATYDGSLYTLIMDKQNIIAYGPPGTGKTREAFIFANWWRNKYGTNTVHSITFHPSYSYEEFIEGYRPSGDGSGFKLKSGLFKQICEQAINDTDKKFLLIIDEINRGDIARIFGELITLIEKDKRGDKFLTILPGSGETFYVPENLFILGTMNTADKSISLMDLAIRRRFLFYPFYPDPEVLNEGRDFINKIGSLSLSGLLIGINQRLIDIGIDKDRILGHSYFLINMVESEPIEILKNRFQFEIIPLIEEYCYADRSLMKNVLGELVDDMGCLNTDLWDDSEKLMDSLKAIDAE